MIQYKLLVHCIVRKQAETVYKTGKEVAYIAKLYKTELIKKYQCSNIAVSYRDTSRILEHFDISIHYIAHYCVCYLNI